MPHCCKFVGTGLFTKRFSTFPLGGQGDAVGGVVQKTKKEKPVTFEMQAQMQTGEWKGSLAMLFLHNNEQMASNRRHYFKHQVWRWTWL